VFLKWLQVSDVYLTSTGRLLVGGLSGASLASYASTRTGASLSGTSGSSSNSGAGASGSGKRSSKQPTLEDQFSITGLSNQLSEQKNNHRLSSGSAGGGGSSEKKPHKRRSSSSSKRNFFLVDGDEEELDEAADDERRAQAKAARDREQAKKLGLPRGALYTVAPEVLCGGQASPESTTYSAMAVCTQILTGGCLVKVRRTNANALLPKPPCLRFFHSKR
jgi:hypothetical protein